jgi:hypothetical protein
MKLFRVSAALFVAFLVLALAAATLALVPTGRHVGSRQPTAMRILCFEDTAVNAGGHTVTLPRICIPWP